MEREVKIIYLLSEVLQKDGEIKKALEELESLMSVKECMDGLDCSDAINGNAISGTVGFIDKADYIKTEYKYQDVKVSLHESLNNAPKVLVKALLDQVKDKELTKFYRRLNVSTLR